MRGSARQRVGLWSSLMFSIILIVCAFVFPACALAAVPAQEAGRVVRTGDGLALELRPDGAVGRLTLDGRVVGSSTEPGGFFVTEFQAPNGERREWGAIRGRLTGRDS